MMSLVKKKPMEGGNISLSIGALAGGQLIKNN
jgi:hypothetical protein